ncbi:LytTR family DNA-binding domain-containing protein [Faecalicatena contorta]|uniref:LytTr DNA-binding domain-containing protein n=1 Tax=Faecalicatena contorta TaxID=39482 RepID=A0A316A255_9FIRM|nr:LytTR family DNA-binding domain-containing protein [Faecalicatena contorta]PWJ50794.1 LytTR family transcriptional regulator [Faecalicatena contorta]SUQ13362.1 LytTr DNA-binding domain-containing protein [Faecalicatena contorta]
MKIRIEIDENLIEEEVIVRGSSLNEQVQQIQRALSEISKQEQRIVFHKDETEYYLPLTEILFFETDGKAIHAHTAGDIYLIKHRLYELEEILPGYFMRVSKSTILNVRCIYSINRSVSTSCVVQFKDTHKQVYVSRYYYKPLRNRLEEKR